ncbi:MAG: hypothetical protein AB7I04_04555 [Pseudomonadales bacterium]
MSSTTGLVLFLATSLLLSACSGSSESVGTPAPVDGSARTLSGFVGSPSLVDATVTVLVDDGATTVSARSADDASYTVRTDKTLAPPVQVQAAGGTNLLTGQPNGSTLSALSFDATPDRLMVSHLSTLAAAMAGCGGPADQDSLNRAWERLRASTGLDFVDGTRALSSVELGAVIRANLALSEAAERTRSALSTAGRTLSADDVLEALACDLADDGRLNDSGSQTDARLVSVFRSAEAAIILEMISGTPHVDGQQADVQLDETLRQVSGDPGASVAMAPIPEAMIVQARSNLALLDETLDDSALMDLSIAVSGSPAEVAADTRSTLDAAHLTTLWALPERVALADDTQIAQLDADMVAQASAGVPIVSLSASRTSVGANETVTLSWASAGARRCRAAGDWRGSRALEGTWTTPSLTEASEFRLYCRGLGGVGSASVEVAVVEPAERPVVSLSADDPTLDPNQSTVIRWTSSNATGCTASGAWSGSRPVVGNTGIGPLSTDADYTLTCSGPGGSDTATLQITVDSTPLPPPSQPAPTLSFSVSPSTVQSGQTATLSWSATNTTSCQASGGWSGSRAASGSATSTPLTANTTFALNCTGPGGTTTRTRTVTVTAAPPPTPAPTLTFSATPGTVQSGQSVTLAWSTTNATSCQAGNGWSGARATSGSESRGPLTSSSSFSLTCSGAGGSVTQTRSVTVTAAPPAPAPTVSLSAASTLVNSGSSTTLSWSSTNATACTASGGWSGSRGTSGSASTGSIARQTTFSLSCSGAGGSALAMVSISVRGTVTLNWVAPTENVDGTPLTDLAGYRVYYGTASRSYTNMRDVTGRTATSTSFTLPSGDYHVAMTALDGEGNESAYSNEVLKSVP